MNKLHEVTKSDLIAVQCSTLTSEIRKCLYSTKSHLLMNHSLMIIVLDVMQVMYIS